MEPISIAVTLSVCPVCQDAKTVFQAPSAVSVWLVPMLSMKMESSSLRADLKSQNAGLAPQTVPSVT
jgi:hypothetical protein